MNRFLFVEDHRHAFGVKRLCEVIGVNRSSYYKWREAADTELAHRVRVVHDASDSAYGSPRITAELRDQGELVNHKRVARVMRKFGIVGTHLRRRVRTTVPDPAAGQVPDLFGRDFTATEPGIKLMGDITYLPVGDGQFLYLATVLDCLKLRRLRQAHAWYGTARTAADDSGHPVLRARVRLQAAMLPYYYGPLATAVELARDARYITKGRPSPTAAFAAAAEARALAQQHDATASSHAMRSARALLGDWPAKWDSNTHALAGRRF